jgi:hypothetical protein
VRPEGERALARAARGRKAADQPSGGGGRARDTGRSRLGRADCASGGDRAFARQRAETEAAIAKAAGTAQGGEAWIVAQQSLSLLDAARSPVRDAVASIEALRSEPANAASGNRAAIAAAASTIEEIDDAEASVVAALGSKLGG